MATNIPKSWVDVLNAVISGVRWMTLRASLGFFVTWKWLSTMVRILDDGQDRLFQGFYARLPGVGTPTALGLIGQSRGLLRGIGEPDDAFALYLRGWLQLWPKAGSQLGLARAISHYCGNVKVKVVNRAGRMTTVFTDGTYLRQTLSAGVWDWDSKSNTDFEAALGLQPAAKVSEQWVIVYSPPWARRANWGTGGILGSDPDKGVGHLVPRVDVDAIVALLDEWKSARTRIVCVVFVYDATLFDETNPAKMPDGYFGKWGRPDPSNPARLIASRFADCRYWEPSPYFTGGPTP